MNAHAPDSYTHGRTPVQHHDPSSRRAWTSRLCRPHFSSPAYHRGTKVDHSGSGAFHCGPGLNQNPDIRPAHAIAAGASRDGLRCWLVGAGTRSGPTGHRSGQNGRSGIAAWGPCSRPAGIPELR
ncbi:hypothetical protein HNR10_000701 [Nocardiopsis aegyptia]|uniref:Uncharacterized protein n=1 Tax=Nocardiopsis aegyptia TaxID=220378 RepID=A0A7Z0J8Z4_9ACTN|nr:hypothetical protein [Nocardiopsis aegyptia]